MNTAYFLVQVKHNKNTDGWDKGVVVKADPEDDNKGAALQSYHAYLGAYAYKHDPTIDYVYAEVVEAESGIPIIKELWIER
jgi:hypothetical protein